MDMQRIMFTHWRGFTEFMFFELLIENIRMLLDA